jgi:hypothetical protein
MKKQFAIKVAQVSNTIVASAAKHESANVLKLLASLPCCSTMIQFSNKPVFSL